MCKRSDVATEVTLLPVTQLGVDAAILFADILLVLEPLGIGFEFTAGDGPQIEQPVRTRAAVDAVATADRRAQLARLRDADGAQRARGARGQACR